MKSLTVRCLLAAILIVSLGGCQQMLEDISAKSTVTSAKKRVEVALTGAMKGAGSDELEKGILKWTHKGSRHRLEGAYDDFHTWLKKKSLFRNITSFEVLEAELEEEGFDTVIVKVKINARAYWIKVPKDHQMSWSKKPRRK